MRQSFDEKLTEGLRWERHVAEMLTREGLRTRVWDGKGYDLHVTGGRAVLRGEVKSHPDPYGWAPLDFPWQRVFLDTERGIANKLKVEGAPPDFYAFPSQATGAVVAYIGGAEKRVCEAQDRRSDWKDSDRFVWVPRVSLVSWRHLVRWLKHWA